MAISKIENCSDLLSLVTYVDKLKSIIKKDFSLSFEEFAVLTYINDTDEEEYHLKKIINKLNYKQPQIVKAVKTYHNKTISLREEMNMTNVLY